MGRATKLIVMLSVAGFMVVTAFPLMIIFLPLILKPPDTCLSPAMQEAASTVSLNGSALTVKGTPMKADQRKVAQAAANAVVRRPADFKTEDERKRAMMALFAGGIVESRLINVDYGDRDSLGFLQQRPSQGWGTVAQVQDVNYAANKFLDVFITLPNWKTIGFDRLGYAVQDVQRSAFPDRYQEVMPEAERIYQSLTGFEGVGVTAQVNLAGRDCDEKNSPTDKAVNEAILAAQAMLGQKLPGAEAVVKAYADADVKLPNDIDELANFKGSDTVTVENIDPSNVTPGTLKRGDVLVYSDYAGLFQSSPSNGLKIATYNVLGSHHTAGRDPRPAGVKRIETSARLIKSNGFAVVGMQELEADQRVKLMRLLPASYKIFPESANYGRNGRPPRVGSPNSVVYDSNQVRFIEGTNLPMPFYMGGQRIDIPLIRFEYLATGQVFRFINTHEPAHGPNTRFRNIDAGERAGQIERLAQDDIPLFYVGDMNSTKRALPHKVITRSGEIEDAFDTWRSQGTPTRGPPWGIDRVYGPAGVEVTDVGSIRSARTASDHPVVHATYGGPFATASDDGPFGTMIVPNAQGIVDERPVTKRGLVGVIRLTITEPEPEGGVVVAPGDWTLPVKKGAYRLTSPFGPRWGSIHTGLDFAAPTGTPVYAVANGRVRDTISKTTSYGNHIIQELDDGTELYYAHLSGFKATAGRTVQAGEVIGYVGSTGNSTGPHLHFEVRPGGGAAVDPKVVLTEEGVAP